MEKAKFNKGTGDFKRTKPPAKQEGKEPDPAGTAGSRASADSAATSTPKAGGVTGAAQREAKDS